MAPNQGAVKQCHCCGLHQPLKVHQESCRLERSKLDILNDGDSLSSDLCVDILASRFNNKLHLFAERTKEPLLLALDALIIPGSLFRLICAFSLVQILPHLLHKIEKDKKLVHQIDP